MSYESAASVQAELRTVRGSTIERKHMSTKTTFKRIALVTVAALGVSILGTSASFAGAETVTYAFTAGTSPTTKPAVGSAVLLPLASTVAVAPVVAGATGIITATITTKPVGSTLATESTTAAINLATIDTGTTGVTLETVTASAGAVKLTAKAGTTAKTTAETATVISFIPDAPGYYVITLTATGTGTTTIAGASSATIGVLVAGASAVQAASGIGTAAAKQLPGRQSAVAFYLPVGTTTASRYEITSTGIGIQGIFEMTADLVNVALATDATAITRVTKKNGTDYTSGATYAGRATVTGVIASGSAVRDGIVVTINSAVAAVGTITVKAIDGATGELTTVASATVTYAAAVVADTKADATSTSILAKGAIANSAQIIDSATVTAAKTSGTQAATIYVTQKSAITTAVPNESMTVTISGPGLLGAGTSHTEAASGRSLLVKNGHYITVWPDNTSGEATITIVAATSGVTLGVEKVTFFDTTPSSASVVVNKAHILAGTGSVADVFTVKVLDKSGNAVTALSALTAAAVDTTTVVGGAVTCSTTYNTTKAGFLCSVVGKSATKFGKVSYKFTAAGTDTAETEVTATADVTFSFGVAKTVVITGPTTAGYGEEITLTFTAKDENDLPIADQTYEGAAATGGLFWNTTTVPVYVGSGFAPFNSGETITTVSGVATKKLTLPTAGPLASASWTLAGDGIVAAGAVDKSIGKTKVTYSVTLTNPAVDAATDAANEATDAANAATDAALAAAEAADAATSAAQEASDAVAALSESVTKLIAGLQSQIKSLAAVVAKIARKVKA
jgi:trimeric autotransporter adhesin